MKPFLKKTPRFGVLMALALVVTAVGAGLLTQRAGKAASGIQSNIGGCGTPGAFCIGNSDQISQQQLSPDQKLIDLRSGGTCDGGCALGMDTPGHCELTQYCGTYEQQTKYWADYNCRYNHAECTDSTVVPANRDYDCATYGTNCSSDAASSSTPGYEGCLLYGINCPDSQGAQTSNGSNGGGGCDKYGMVADNTGTGCHNPDTGCYKPQPDGVACAYLVPDTSQPYSCADYVDYCYFSNSTPVGDVSTGGAICPYTDRQLTSDCPSNGASSSEPGYDTAAAVDSNHFIEIMPGILVLCDGGDNESHDCPKNPDGSFADPGSPYYVPYYAAPAGQCEFQDNPQYCDDGGSAGTSAPQPTVVNDPNIGDGSSTAPISAGPDCNNDRTLEYCVNNNIGQDIGEGGYGYGGDCSGADPNYYCGPGGSTFSYEGGYCCAYTQSDNLATDSEYCLATNSCSNESGYEPGYEGGYCCAYIQSDNPDPDSEYCFATSSCDSPTYEPGYEPGYAYEPNYEGGYTGECEYTDHPEYCE